MKSMSAHTIECSAKTNVGVIEAFQELVVQVRRVTKRRQTVTHAQMLKRNGGDRPASAPTASRPVDLLEDDGDAQDENVGCIC